MSADTASTALDAASEPLLGTWTYRSFLNLVDVTLDFDKLELGRGTIAITSVADDRIDGVLDMGSGYALTLRSELIRDGDAVAYTWRGEGVAGTATAGWIYDYFATPTHHWQAGRGQAQVLVGSVLRVVQHGTSPAGVVGTFYMIRQ